MAFVLGPAACAAGFGLAAFDAIGSTNAEGLARARAGERGPLWLVTAHQFAGHGRRGRRWEGPPGNLAATVLRTLAVPPSVAATLGFVAGLALADALEAVGAKADVILDGGGQGVRRFALKWPNDVLADGAKLAGILLETVAQPDGSLAIAVGIGVNVAAAPEGLPYPVTSLARLGLAVDAETLFLHLTDAWLVRESEWDEGRGLPATREQWLARCMGIGQRVVVRTGDRVTRGILTTLDDEGRLVIEDEQGRAIAISAGEVHFGVAATEGEGSA
ncbi:MAG TPA: biotin--[acetyl-CoA-carboxylase] ligase [Xanthobacteraceae bacterium]|nr:biotin--[acetyl-CoA-carboxylase] ligase [Xanthobacteraceae bacterium]